jgi:asparagine synthetase B (glutamine-hydrolysing)
VCGLIGVYTKSLGGFNSGETDCFEDLLFIDMLRGDDSTGITSFLNTGEVQVLKGIGDSYSMRWYDSYGAKEYKEVMADAFKKGKVLLGHNRKATVGQVTDETAHPFVVNERYFFMHNGTLRGHRKLNGGNTYEVDSEALGNYLCPKATNVSELEAALGEVDGAYAMQWVDQEKQMLYLLRNNERPLHIARTSDGYIWASEPGFILAAAARNRQKIEAMIEAKAHTLYSLDLDGYDQKFKETELSVKKALPPITQVITMGDTAATWVSKSKFKKLNKEWEGRTCTFYLDDYMNTVIGGPESTKWHIWGSNVGMFPFRHTISGMVNGVTEAELVCKYDAVKLRGEIFALEYDADKGEVNIMVKNLKITEEVH